MVAEATSCALMVTVKKVTVATASRKVPSVAVHITVYRISGKDACTGPECMAFLLGRVQ